MVSLLEKEKAAMIGYFLAASGHRMEFIGSNWMHDPTQRSSRFVPTTAF